jgi:ABC-2 type transport system ATP-binding protein
MIEVDGVTRRYGSFTAVDAVSFRIGGGEVVGLLGHNGAGKTTIMKMMTGYLEPSAGTITVDGLDVVADRRAVQSRIGYLPENCPIYPEMTVIDYLAYAATVHEVPEPRRPAAIRSAIQRTELSEKADQPIATLSRGYRQRVGVAQAILHDPKILILDEPTNGLDPTQIRHMRSLVKSLAQTATVIVSTHILQEVQAVCGRVLILRSGRLVTDAALADLGSRRGLRLTIDAAPDEARAALAGLAPLAGIDHLGGEDGLHRYALRLGGDSLEAAPEVAGAVVSHGLKLFALEPERYDLEAVFAAVNAPDREAAHA